MPILRMKLLEDREGESKMIRNNLVREVVGRMYRRKWLATLSTVQMTEEEILADPLCPQAGDPYPGNNLATIVSVTLGKTNNPRFWYVNLVYDTERLVQLITDNPLEQPPEIYYGTFKYSAPMVYDQLGVPVLTSAGNRFDPVASYNYPRDLITITRNIAEFPMARKRRFNMKLNALPFLDFPRLTGCINDIQGRRMLSNGVLFWQETTELEFRTAPDSFFDFYLDADYRDSRGFVFHDPLTKLPYSNPSMLNGRGVQASEAFHTLLTDLTPNESQYDTTSDPSIVDKFPPPPPDLLPNGMRPGPYNTEFTIEIRSKANKNLFEIIKVIGGIDTGIWRLKRKTLGSTNTNWIAGEANVRLLAYYLKYTPYLPVDWTPLNFTDLGLE